MERKLALQTVQLLLAVGLGISIGFRVASITAIFAILAGLVWLGYLAKGRIWFVRLLPWLLGVVLVAELVARAWFQHDKMWPYWTPGWDAVRAGYERPGPVDDEHFDVLVLGGSVVSDECVVIPPRLEAIFAAYQDRPVRLHDIATPGHTSRDSLLKWREYKGRKWDAIVLYHGINDARLNSVPIDVFEDDYSHFPFYAEKNRLARWRWCGGLLLPAFVDKVSALGRDRGVKFRSRHDPEWRELAATNKTAEPFARNYAEIIADAQDRGILLVTGTFAVNMERGDKVDTWGIDKHVRHAVEQHNERVRQLQPGPGLIVVEWDQSLSDQPDYFVDRCHFTPVGADAWAALLTAALMGTEVGTGLPPPAPVADDADGEPESPVETVETAATAE